MLQNLTCAIVALASLDPYLNTQLLYMEMAIIANTVSTLNPSTSSSHLVLGIQQARKKNGQSHASFG